MKNGKNGISHFIAIAATIVFIVLGFGSTCSSSPAATASQEVDNSYPLVGTNNVSIAGKDFITVGIVFVNSAEVSDNLGNHTGSKITYEMFMREALKLEADDVINIKIDVNRKIDRETIKSSTDPKAKPITKIITTYTYTGTGLAIKYTDAVEYNSNIARNLTNTMEESSIEPVALPTPSSFFGRTR